MLITINILSALAIVMALFIPYFILLHLNNKLRKEVEGALNRVLELKVYSQITNERLIEFMEVSNINFDSQDKNWERYDKTIELLKEGLIMSNSNFKKIDKCFVHTLDKINDLYSKINQKQTLKEILETPIEVKKPACETKLKLKEEVNANDIKTVTEIVNKVDFKHSHGSFKKGDIFVLNKDDLKVYRDKILVYDYHSWTTFGKNVMKKLLKLNEQNEN
jgi:hypothetical protein